MTNRISNEVKASVLEMFKNGAKKSEIAARCGISPRSVGRIIDSDKQNNSSNSCVKNTDDFKEFAEKVLERVEPTEGKNFDGLLPCPFCGGNAYINSERFSADHSSHETAYYVECSKCHLMTDTVKIGLQERYKDKNHRKLSTVEAINRITKIWNSRFKGNRKEALK